MAQHTPGPWASRRATGVSGDIGITAEGVPGVLAECFSDIRRSYEGAHEEAAANARLIAAAPELLTAGKHLAVKLADTYRAANVNPAECQAIRDFVAAVDKAEGRS